MGENGDRIRPGWVLEEMGGQEPLALVHLLLLHLAEQCTEGPLIAQRGLY